MKNLTSLFLLCILTLLSAYSVAHPDWKNLDVQKAQMLMTEGKLSSEQLVKYYLENISLNNRRGQDLRAIAQINPQALSDARQLDKERKSGQVRGPLHGIPVVLKDNIDTGEGMANTAGSVALQHNFPPDDAQFVASLKSAGAVIMGKTNLSEWANFRSFYSSSGWSSLYGQTKNPHDNTRNTCGSSSGSGAAIAADFALLAVGTETNGSIVCPSAVNGVVGIKPSVGTVSRDGIIPISHSQDTAGPMAKSVADAELLLEAMASFDQKDPKSKRLPENLSAHLRADGLQGKRIGVARELMGFHFGVDQVIEAALVKIQEAGAELIDIDMPNRGKFGNDEFEVLLYEFKDGLNRYLKQAKTGHSLESLIRFNETHRQQVMPFFEQELFTMAQGKGPLTDKVYLDALANSRRMAGPEGIDAVMQEHQLDLIVSPTSQPAWKTDHVNGDHFLGGSSSYAAVSGYPHVTVPAGTFRGLPVGISFYAGDLSEPILIEAAFAFEQASKQQ